jgi:hypothetical protein
VFNHSNNWLRDLVNRLAPPPDFFRPTSSDQPPVAPLHDRAASQAQNRPSARGTEASYRDRLAQSLGGEIEVVTPVGRIDIVTATEIIEVKAATQWKQAFGQIMMYGHYYPQHQKRIHLFGKMSTASLAQVEAHCGSHGVRVTWQP